jgi:ketosteroid isomerase-like protein
MPHSLGILFALATLCTPGSSSAAHGSSGVRSVASLSDSADVVGIVSRFHAALEAGDTVTVRTLIAPDLQVLEGGQVESRAQYFAHHLAADIEFARAVRSERTVVSYAREQNVAWLVSASTASGNFKGRDINSIGAELMILSRTPGGWKIRAIHWSSARRPPR